jgi:hypothetical protein
MAIKKRTLRKFPGLEDDKDDDDAFRITVLDRPTGSGTVIDRDLIIVGDPAGHHLRILSGEEGGIEIRDGETLRGHWRIGGDILIGRDLGDPETSFMVVFAQAQKYNGEDMLAGDVLLGDNSEGAANLLWRQSDGRIYARSGQQQQAIVDQDLMVVGSQAGHHLQIQGGEEGGIEIRDGDTLRGHWRAGGDILIGRDLADPATTFLTVFSQAQQYNGENMLAGDVLLGDNSEGAANLLWRQNDGRIYIRGGQDVQATIDTDGSIIAGAGNLRLNQYGIAITADLAGALEEESAYRFTDDQGNTVSALYGYYSSEINGWHNLVDAKPERNSFYELLIRAPSRQQATYELTLQSGTQTTSIEMLADDNDINYISFLSQRINFTAEAVRFPNRTTAQRDAIVGPQKGMVLFNITVDKLQVYTGTAWVNLH